MRGKNLDAYWSWLNQVKMPYCLRTQKRETKWFTLCVTGLIPELHRVYSLHKLKALPFNWIRKKYFQDMIWDIVYARHNWKQAIKVLIPNYLLILALTFSLKKSLDLKNQCSTFHLCSVSSFLAKVQISVSSIHCF